MKVNDPGTMVTSRVNMQSGAKTVLSPLKSSGSIKHVNNLNKRNGDVHVFEGHPTAESSKPAATFCPESTPGGVVPSSGARRLRAAATAAVRAGEIAATYRPGRWSGDFVPGPGRGLVLDTGTEDLRAAMVLFPRLLKSSSGLPSKVRETVREAVEQAAATAAVAKVVAAATEAGEGCPNHETWRTRSKGTASGREEQQEMGT